jgi:hypothetical protein
VAVPFATEVIESAPVSVPPVTEFTVSGDWEYGWLFDVALSTGNEIAA